MITKEQALEIVGNLAINGKPNSATAVMKAVPVDGAGTDSIGNYSGVAAAPREQYFVGDVFATLQMDNSSVDKITLYLDGQKIMEQTGETGSSYEGPKEMPLEWRGICFSQLDLVNSSGARSFAFFSGWKVSVI